jgi:hypothetical protein
MTRPLFTTRPFITTRRLFSAAAFAAVTFTAGCQSDPADLHDGIADFRPDAEPRQVDKFLAAQAAEGAKDDAMLREHHFTGTTLNSLGQQKFESIYAAMRPGEVATIYLVLNENDANSAARRDAVLKYADARGVVADSLKLAYGTNPKGYPAAPILDRMDRPVENSSSTSGGMSLMSPSGSK